MSPRTPFPSIYGAFFSGLNTWYRLTRGEAASRRHYARYVLPTTALMRSIDAIAKRTGQRSQEPQPPVKPPFGFRERARAVLDVASFLATLLGALTLLRRMWPSLSARAERDCQEKRERYRQIAAAAREYGLWSRQARDRALSKKHMPASQTQRLGFAAVAILQGLSFLVASYESERRLRDRGYRTPEWYKRVTVATQLASPLYALDAATGLVPSWRMVPRWIRRSALGLLLAAAALASLMLVLAAGIQVWTAFQSRERLQREYDDWRRKQEETGTEGREGG